MMALADRLNIVRAARFSSKKFVLPLNLLTQLQTKGKIMSTPQEVKTEKPKETKTEKYDRVSKRRVKMVLKIMRLIENLSNKNEYEATPDKVDFMLAALFDGVKKIETAFEGKKEPEDFDYPVIKP